MRTDESSREIEWVRDFPVEIEQTLFFFSLITPRFYHLYRFRPSSKVENNYEIILSNEHIRNSGQWRLKKLIAAKQNVQPKVFDLLLARLGPLRRFCYVQQEAISRAQ